jgi:hypothetical protein
MPGRPQAAFCRWCRMGFRSPRILATKAPPLGLWTLACGLRAGEFAVPEGREEGSGKLADQAGRLAAFIQVDAAGLALTCGGSPNC